VAGSVIQFGEFVLDCDRFELFRDGRPVKMEKIPMELLMLLAKREGHLVTREEIIDHLWGKDTFLDTQHGINTAVRKIRLALRDDSDQPRFVQTVMGKGYRFVADVKNQEGNNHNAVQIPRTESVAIATPSAPAEEIARPAEQIRRFGAFEINLDRRELLQNGEPVKLRDQSFLLLAALLEQPGELVTREEFRSKLWTRGTFVDFDHSLNAAIKRLRDDLGDDSDTPRFIETVPKRGYRFLASVEDPSIGQIESSPLSLTPVVVAVQTKRDLTPVWRTLGYLALLGVVVSIALYVFPRRPLVDSIAIVPLANLTGNPEMDYLGDGMTDVLINNISQVPNLKVISGSSMRRYKGRDIDLQTLGRELQVQAVLTGKYALRRNNLLISVELTDLRDNRHIWGEQYNRSLDDMAEVQEEVSRQITDMLRLTLTQEQRQRISRKLTVDPEAYQLYLKGRYYQLKDTPEDLRKSREYYEQAIDADPSYAPAYNGLAQFYGYMAWAGELSPTEAGAKQEAAAARAMELDPSLGIAHCETAIVSLFYKWNWTAVEKETKLCLTLSPNEAEAHFSYAIYLRTMRRFNDALREARRAEELDPLTPERKTLIGSVYYFARKYDYAAEQYRQLTQSDPDLPAPHIRLFDIYSRTGRESDAISELQKGLSLQGADDLAAALLPKYKSSGFLSTKEFAVREQIKLLLEASKHEYIAPTALAANYSLVNEKDQAFGWLEKAFAEHSPDLVDLNLDPDYDNLHADKRFQDLVQRIGLP
jgi:DNA-binding winged helix-turn-helix (wHTH) protein/TolB-like protein